MIYTVSLDSSAIDFAPESEVAEILQNVRTILKTRIGTVPLHRSFGVSWEHVDKPVPVAKALMQAMVIEAITAFEPRATVKSVTFPENTTDMMDGLLKAVVKISIEEA